MKNTFHLIFLLMCMAANAQVFPVQVSVQLVAPHSPFLSDYTTPGTQNLIVQMRANDITLINYPCKLRITIEGVGIRITTSPHFSPGVLTLEGGGQPQIFYGEDLAAYFHPNALEFSGFTRREYEKSARLPEGVYRFTIEVLDYYRGTVVSNKGMTTVWIMHNDPPLLNLPANLADVIVQQPTYILFTWTPRHTGSPNAAFSTEYIFRLVELWPEHRNPYDAFLTQQPLFETTTTQSQLLYAVNEPTLVPGRQYAWQVEARDMAGRDLFKNHGRSEVFVFKYGQPLAVPENLDMRWAKPTTLAIRWDPVRDPTEEIKYRLQYRPRRRSEPHDWYETRTQFTEKTLYQLQSNTEYEMRVRAEKTAQESEYSAIRVFKTLPAEVDAFVCKDNVEPPPLPEDSFPVFPLGINDTLHAGGYEVLVRDVIQIDGRYYGSGFAIVPWLNEARIRVTFEKISVNERFWLKSGVIKSVWNPESDFLLEIETPITAGNAPQAGHLDITIVAADSLIIIQGAAIAAVTKNEEGNLVVTTTDGKEQVLPRGESYAIADEAGNGYVIDKQGNIAKTSAAEARASAARGDRSYDLAFQFSKGEAKFGFDEMRFDALAPWYQQLDDGTYAAWKALSTSQTDAIQGRLLSGQIDVSEVRFEAGAAPVVTISQGDAKVKLSLQGKMAGMEEELLAIYSNADSLPDKILGKINLATYDPIHYNLEIVPVNGTELPGGLTVETISEKLNEVYNQAVVGWSVGISTPLSVPLDEKFDEGETGLFSNYSADMKKVLHAHGRFQDNTYYLFLIAEPRSESTLGYMPRNKQAGFVFIGPHKGDTQEFLKTIAHELGHGAFNLKHTFLEHNLPSGSTDNLMDYNSGTALYKYQWDYIHEPQRVMGLFEGEEAGAMDISAFKSAFTRQFGEKSSAQPCLTEAAEHGLKVFSRFDLDVALYSSFLRIVLCATRKENCLAINYQSAFSCGFTNALLQEIDWITMLESIEGIGVDIEKVLLCILDSYPIGSREDNVKLGEVAFKCLTGVQVQDLVAGIKDFIIANWDDPYYQGQATAFTLTLFTPFKGKVVTKIAELPEFAGKLDNFKALSKAGNSDELIEISNDLLKGKTDDLVGITVEAGSLAEKLIDLPVPVGKFRQLIGQNNTTYRAASFWKETNSGFKTVVTKDQRYLLKHDPTTGRMLFADIENKTFIGFGLDEANVVGNDYARLLQNLKTIHGLPGGAKSINLGHRVIPLSSDKANAFFGKYRPNDVPGVTGEIGTDDIIDELSILKNYSFADASFELRPGSVHILNIPDNMPLSSGMRFFDVYNKYFLDMVIKNMDRFNVVFVSDPRKVDLLDIFLKELGQFSGKPSGFAKEIRYLRDHGIQRVEYNGSVIDLSSINLDNLDWSQWEY
jgi:hypothetical protein